MSEFEYVEPEIVSEILRPTSRQLYKLLSVALEASGFEWPTTRREATELINGIQLSSTLRRLQGE